jgi:CheY-like chemotaxis protein
MRLFFDYTTRDRAIYDYKGDEFLSLDDAFDFAETTAETMKHSLNGDWTGWSVEVRDAECKKYFSLPINIGRPAVTVASPESDRSASKPGSLLIIEDALIHSTVISRIARKAGFTITRANTYEDACKVLREQEFDCITLDLGLGERVGVDVLRYLSMIRRAAQIIIVSQSDKDVCDDVVELGRALDLNVYGFVQKPIDIEVLYGTLTHIQGQLLPQ